MPGGGDRKVERAERRAGDAHRAKQDALDKARRDHNTGVKKFSFGKKPAAAATKTVAPARPTTATPRTGPRQVVTRTTRGGASGRTGRGLRTIRTGGAKAKGSRRKSRTSNGAGLSRIGGAARAPTLGVR